MKLFAEHSLGDYLRQQLSEMEAALRNEAASASGSDAGFLEDLQKRYAVQPLTILWDKASTSEREKMVRYEELSRFAGGLPGRSYPKQVVVVSVPFEGAPQLLRCQPNNFQVWTHSAEVIGSTFVIEYLNIADSSDQVKQWFESAKRHIDEFVRNSRNQVESFNKSDIGSRAAEALDLRKQELARRALALKATGLPVHAPGAAPLTIPIKKRKLVLAPPGAASSAPVTLDDAQFDAIAQVIFDTGVGCERLPSTYAGKDEEGLRDLFIVQLGTHFVSATAETFNSEGKTDILLRHQNTNLFVAECKFWKGPKGLLEAIDQLLGYLTWRDCKAALMMFVQNRELGAVLDQIESTTATHGRFIRTRGKRRPGWFEFDLTISGGGSVRLAVLLFYFPP